MRRVLFSLFLVVAIATAVKADENVVQHLQDVSVTVKSNSGEGSGVLITREHKDGDKTVLVNYVLTAGHVVDSLRSVRTVIDPIKGTTKQLVEFKDAEIVKEIVEDGRRVGELKMDAKVVKFSNADFGQDLALLMVRKRDYVKPSTKFYLEKDIVPIGTELIHVGSLRGQFGSNSMTSGIMSQIGRVIDVGKSTVFDQTTVTAFPGSSGGGVFTKDGKYIGMLVRGAGETFNLIVPIRRMKSWCKDNSLEWVIDETKPTPTYDELEKMAVEDVGKGPSSSAGRNNDNYKYLFKYND